MSGHDSPPPPTVTEGSLVVRPSLPENGPAAELQSEVAPSSPPREPISSGPIVVPGRRREVPRFLAVVFPRLSLDRVMRQMRRGRRERPQAADTSEHVHLTIETVASRQVVVQVDQAGCIGGIRPGMTVAQGRALVPGTIVHLHPHRSDLDARTVQGLARWMVRITPRVMVDGSDGLLLDLTGCGRLHPDEPALMRRIHGAFTRVGFRSRLALAGTPGAAWAMARYGQPTDGSEPNIAVNPSENHPCEMVDGCGVRVASGQERAAVARLPVAALRCPESVVDELAQVGIEWIADVLRVPRHELAGRGAAWRPDGMLGRLDQVLGRRPEPFDPIQPPRRPVAEWIFDGPVLQPEAIVLTVRELLSRLVDEMETLGCGVTRLDLRCTSPDLGPQAFRITLGHPSRSMQHLWTLLAPRLERIHLDHGIDAVRLEASRMASIREQQAAGLGLNHSAAAGAAAGGGRDASTSHGETSSSPGKLSSDGSAFRPGSSVDGQAPSAGGVVAGPEDVGRIPAATTEVGTLPASKYPCGGGESTVAGGAARCGNSADDRSSDRAALVPAAHVSDPDADSGADSGVAGDQPIQLDPAERRRQEAGVAALMDTLIDRLGPDRVMRRQATHSHVPECAAESVPAAESPVIRLDHDVALDASPSGSPAKARSSADLLDAPDITPMGRPVFTRVGESLEADATWRITPFHRRPSVLLEPPEALAMEPPEFEWRGHRRRIVSAVGPEQIASPWWAGRRLVGGGMGADPGSASLTREYLRVQDEHGRWWWIFRRRQVGSEPLGGAPLIGRPGGHDTNTASRFMCRWYLHGIWG